MVGGYSLIISGTIINTMCQEKNGLSGISLVSSILAFGKIRIL
jgi:hypothetical protein